MRKLACTLCYLLWWKPWPRCTLKPTIPHIPIQPLGHTFWCELERLGLTNGGRRLADVTKIGKGLKSVNLDTPLFPVYFGSLGVNCSQPPGHNHPVSNQHHVPYRNHQILILLIKINSMWQQSFWQETLARKGLSKRERKGLPLTLRVFCIRDVPGNKINKLCIFFSKEQNKVYTL